MGLTGNVASGKSTVAELWRSWGVPVVSADVLARQAVLPGSAGLASVVRAFGEGILAPDGSLNRAALRRVVFDDDAARRRLEAIVHPSVRVLRDKWTDARRSWGVELLAWEIPLLYETGADREVDRVVFVDAPEAERERRMVQHRGLSSEEARAIMEAQGDPREKRSMAHHVIDNGGSLAALRARARQVLEACAEEVGCPLR
ncbi:MAG: dephospho-CoA kinase [Gemmatimonadetes bacterium]|nr:dephospho-CoA kinase [Gemmatimonadota bacterium]